MKTKTKKNRNRDDNNNIINGHYVRVWYDKDEFDGGDNDGVPCWNTADQYEFDTKKEAKAFCVKIHQDMMDNKIFAFEFGWINDLTLEPEFLIKRG